MPHLDIPPAMMQAFLFAINCSFTIDESSGTT